MQLTTEEIMEKMEAHIEFLEQELKEIGDMAHDSSCGPVGDDVYWDIRRKAYDACFQDWMNQ